MGIENYKFMKMEEYIRKYCRNSFHRFQSKQLRFEFTQDAYNDIFTYFDDKNKVIIIERSYIGD